MFTEAEMKKALGVKRWEKVEDYSFSCGVMDFAFKLPWTHPGYGTTTWVCEPEYNQMTKKDVVDDLKYFIDGLEHDWDLCPYLPNGDSKVKFTLTKETA